MIKARDLSSKSLLSRLGKSSVLRVGRRRKRRMRRKRVVIAS